MNEYRKVVQFGTAMLVTLAVLLITLAAIAQPDDHTTPTEASVLAVAVIDAQMEQTRRQVINLPVTEGRQACADAAWRPAMHQAVHILKQDPVYTSRIDEWATAWGQGLIDCYQGDMANASTGITDAYELKESMHTTATRKRQAKPRT